MLFQASPDASLNEEAHIDRKHKNNDRVFLPGFFDRFPQRFFSADGKKQMAQKNDAQAHANHDAELGKLAKNLTLRWQGHTLVPWSVARD